MAFIVKLNGKETDQHKDDCSKKVILSLDSKSAIISLFIAFIVCCQPVAGVKAEISFRSKFWKLLQHSPFSQKRVFHLTLELVCSISVFAFSKLSNFKGLGFTNSSKASEMLKSERVFYFFLQAVLFIYTYIVVSSINININTYT